jgi:hypothetical protein
VHAEADLHDTALSSAPVAPAGTAAAWLFHAAPFHDSTTAVWVPAASKERPTAVQSVAEPQNTPARAVFVAPAGLSVVSIFQVVPFHDSASVTTLPAVFV